MRRRDFIRSVAASAVVLPFGARAQRDCRIGYLSALGRPADGAPPAGLRDALKQLGYLDGVNLSYVGRWAETRKDRLRGLAAELASLKVDVIVVAGGPASLAAKDATSTIPIVILNAGDAVGTGLVSRLDRPGGNVTGLNDQATELSAKRLEFLMAVVPKASRVAVLWNADDVAMTLRYDEVGRAARSLRVTIVPLGVREPDDFKGAFDAMLRERPDALLMVSDTLTSLNRKRVIDFAAEHRIPAIYEFGSFVRGGGLMAYGAHSQEQWRRVAAYVDKILKGAKPGDLPVEQPTKFELVVNLKTAKALGITIPQSLLLAADEVIE